MKLGFVSVSINAKTGYGRIVREVCSRLLEKYDIVSIGHESDVVVWGGQQSFKFPNGKEMKVLSMVSPLASRAAAAEIVRSYCVKYQLDYLIGFWDAFALPFMADVGVPYAAHIPVDAEMTRKWAGYVERANKVIAYSLYGYDQLKRFFDGSKLAFVPHGVDCDVFRPIEDKARLRAKLHAESRVPEDAFLLVSTQANVGPRKHIPLLLRTFKRFVDSHPNAHLYLHTNAISESPQGYDLPTICSQLGITGNVHWPYYNPILEPIDDAAFCELYNAADAYVSNSVGEGFGLPVLEAMACGTPAIVPDNSSHRELVGGRGWFANSISMDVYADYPIYVPTAQEYPVPDQSSLLNCMEEAYYNEDLRKRLGKASREKALEYDWSRVMPGWFKLLAEIEEEVSVFKEVRSALKA